MLLADAAHRDAYVQFMQMVAELEWGQLGGMPTGLASADLSVPDNWQDIHQDGRRDKDRQPTLADAAVPKSPPIATGSAPLDRDRKTSRYALVVPGVASLFRPLMALLKLLSGTPLGILATDPSRVGRRSAQQSGQSSRGRHFLAIRLAGVLTAGVVVAVCAYWSMSGPGAIVAERDSLPIGKLIASDDAKWHVTFRPQKDARLLEGQTLQLLEGRAQISMSSGAELVFKAPCFLMLTSPNQVDLHDGNLSVQVADWTNEFCVVTKIVQILDLGKQFVVSVDAKNGSVEAHAIDGRLRVQTTNSSLQERHRTLVSAGEAMRFRSNDSASEWLKADGALFDSGIVNSSPFKPLPMHNTGRNLASGDEDPNWRIVASTAEDFKGPSYAIVCNPFNFHLANEPQQSQWISLCSDVTKNCDPNVMHTFQTVFDLSGYDLPTVTVVANVLVDNGVTGIRINGRPVKFKPWIDNAADVFNIYRQVEITDGFVDGLNQIEFDVWNGNIVRDVHAKNPMAFRVEWQAFGRLLMAKPGGFQS
jgi:hypothetical protein